MEHKHYIGLQWKVHFSDKENWGPEKGDGGVLREDGAGGQEGASGSNPNSFMYSLWDPEQVTGCL